MAEEQLDRLKAALADRYAVQRKLGSGGMPQVVTTKVASRQMSLKRRGGSEGHFSDISRVAALAADSRARRPRV